MTFACMTEPSWATPSTDRALTGAQLDRLDRLEGRFPGSAFTLAGVEISGARYEVTTELGETEILITPSGRVVELVV